MSVFKIEKNNNYIINKFAYFRTSLLNNLIKININIELWNDGYVPFLYILVLTFTTSYNKKNLCKI